MKKAFLIFLFLLAAGIGRAQQRRIDSLLSEVDRAKEPEKIKSVLNELNEIPQGSFAALKKGRRDLAAAEAEGAVEKQQRALLIICYTSFPLHDLAGLFAASLKGIAVSRATNNKIYLSRFLHMEGLATSYVRSGNSDVPYYLMAINVAIAVGDTVDAINDYSNIESSYAEYKKPDSALFYAKAELKLVNNLKRPDRSALQVTVFGDTGEAFAAEDQLDSALVYYRKAYTILKLHHSKTLHAE